MPNILSMETLNPIPSASPLTHTLGLTGPLCGAQNVYHAWLSQRLGPGLHCTWHSQGQSPRLCCAQILLGLGHRVCCIQSCLGPGVGLHGPQHSLGSASQPDLWIPHVLDQACRGCKPDPACEPYPCHSPVLWGQMSLMPCFRYIFPSYLHKKLSLF